LFQQRFGLLEFAALHQLACGLQRFFRFGICLSRRGS
jgi:hypothetical protein